MGRVTGIISCLLLAISAAAVQAADSPAQISIIIDDLGNNLRNGERAIALPGAVTFAVLPFTPYGKQLARQGHQQGKEIMLHLPMDNSHGRPLGPGAITFKQDRHGFEQQLDQAIAATPYISGLNNHMGSGLTTSPERMQWLMQSLKHYPLYFVDSRTSVATVAGKTARALDIPSLDRDIFLDHEASAAFIDQQFKRLLKKARRDGHAVAIGHPYPETLDYLEAVLPQLEKLGVELVAPSQLLALDNRPQLVAVKSLSEKPASAAIAPTQPLATTAEETLQVTSGKQPQLANRTDTKPGQCRITEQLDFIRINCG